MPIAAVSVLGVYSIKTGFKAMEQLAAFNEGKGRRTFDENNPCGWIAASPFGSIPFVNAWANFHYPEGETKTGIHEVIKSGTPMLGNYVVTISIKW